MLRALKCGFISLFVFMVSVFSYAFEIGFNQAWQGDYYHTGWTSEFSEQEAIRTIQSAKAYGGTVVRMWVYGSFEGVTWATQSDGITATGVLDQKLANIARFAQIAQDEGVRVYWTILDGNRPLYETNPTDIALWKSIINNDRNAGTIFFNQAVAPVVQVIAGYPGAIFAIDLVNEINALVRYGWFDNGWAGANRLVADWTGRIHQFHPDIYMTASLGHHDGFKAILTGDLSLEPLDFLDVHYYSDLGQIPEAHSLAAVAKQAGLSIYLGEFGQQSEIVDDQLQERVTVNFINSVREAGFSGAFAWRLSENGRKSALALEAGGMPRPALMRIKQLAASWAQKEFDSTALAARD